MHYKQSDFMYNRMGPWPQPNPVLPFEEFATVLHIPLKETLHYERYIGIRYYTQTFYYIPCALWYAFTHKGLIPISDEKYTETLCVHAYSKFTDKVQVADVLQLLPGIDQNLLNENSTYYVTDLYLMRNIPSQPDGQYSAPTVALFESSKTDEFKPVAIWVGNSIGDEPNSTVIYPQDGDAWLLAKYYVLFGCCYRLVLSIHSIMHFPMDSVNAITKTAMPMKNLVFKLLYPYFDFSLELNKGVLTSNNSPIKNHPDMPYTGMTGTQDQIAHLFGDAHIGIPERPKTYPPFNFNLEPLMGNDLMYARFQREYYYCIKRFVKKVLAHLPDDDKDYIRVWADYIEPWINKHVHDKPEYNKDPMRHFPTGDEVFNVLPDGDTVLEKLIAKIIWDLSVGHGSDHYDYSKQNFQQVPFRLRIPPPDGRTIHHFNPADARTFTDTFKHRMEWKIFFLPTNITLLKDTQHNFDDPVLQQYNKEFLADLKQVEKTLAEKGIKNFTPLNQISRSIQY